MASKPNRPHDTPFQQQRLKAWQPILTPRWVIFSFLCMGIIFVPVGLIITSQSNQIFENVVVYDSDALSSSQCSIKNPNEGYQSIQSGSPRSCVITVNITQDIPASSVVHVYYELTNFYQNHQRYVKSRSSQQFRNAVTIPPSGTPSGLSACDPASSLSNATTGKVYWPCGLIAQSYFNDGILLKSYNGKPVNRSTGVEPDTKVSLDRRGVAWKTDLTQKYRNPTGAASNYSRFEYIWQKYDQMSCYSYTTELRVACQTYSDLFGSAIAGTGCAKCPSGSYPVYEGGIPPPGGSEALNSTSLLSPETNETSIYGVRTESFIVWMRTAGLNDFRKLLGYLVPPAGGFKAGDQVEFTVVPNFEVRSFNGTKAIVLSTVNALGGKNSVLGTIYTAVGGVCWGLALAFLVKHLVSPRKLGDTKYIVWRQRGQ